MNEIVFVYLGDQLDGAKAGGGSFAFFDKGAMRFMEFEGSGERKGGRQVFESADDFATVVVGAGAANVRINRCIGLVIARCT